MPLTELPDKEHALREDIRLLGRLLGDAVRHRAGEAAFERIESIRRTAVAFHRAEGAERGATARRAMRCSSASRPSTR